MSPRSARRATCGETLRLKPQPDGKARVVADGAIQAPRGPESSAAEQGSAAGGARRAAVQLLVRPTQPARPALRRHLGLGRWRALHLLSSTLTPAATPRPG